MADRNEQVIEFVRAELGRQPDLGSKALFERAQEVDSSLKGESVQQFHARYVLPIKRERRQDAPVKRTRAAKGASREQAEQQSEETAAAKTTRRGRGRAAAKAESASAETRQGGDSGAREAVRGIFVRFAQEIGSAETRTDAIRVMGDIDTYVEEVIRKLR